MKIKAIIFDLDGTIADTILDLANACNYVLKNAGLEQHSVDKYKQLVGSGRTKLIRDSAPGYAETHLEEMIAQFNDYYATHFSDNTVGYEGMGPVIAQLKKKGYKLCVLSNKPHEMTVPITEKLYPGMFDRIYGQLPDMPTKPSIESIKMICDELSVSTDEILMIGDSEVDIKTAQNVSAPSIAVTWGYRPKETLIQCSPTRLIDTPEQLLKAVSEIDK